MVDKVIDISEGKKGKPKETYDNYILALHYIDGEVEQIECSYFGSYLDNVDFMVFLEGPPSSEGAYPSSLIHTSQIRKIVLIRIEEVEA